MKPLLFTIGLLLSLNAFSNDTLTRAQVYNFSVGDTFDYKDTVWGVNVFGVSGSEVRGYSRYVITSLFYSVGSDTLFIERRKEFPLPVAFDTLVIDSLEEYEYLKRFPLVLIDTSSRFDGKIMNEVYLYGGEVFLLKEFAEGLGMVVDESGGSGDSQGSVDVNSLIYYSHGSEKWGTPYYIDGGMEFIHYTPIPEHCATWTRTIRDNIYLGNSLRLQEKIRTGNIIPDNSHAYVELYYSYHNFDNGTESNDSLIGYFRNDTLNRKAYLYQTLTANPSITYDFSEPVDGTICHIAQVKVDTEMRTIWYGCNVAGFIEGVGGLDGFWPIKQAYLSEPGLPFPIEDQGVLTCFSVCGTVLYPTDSPAVCDFLTAVNEIPKAISDVQLFPNPSTGSWQLTVDESLVGNKVEAFNTEGQVVFQSEIKNQKSEISFPSARGVYLLHISSPEGNVIRKIIKL